METARFLKILGVFCLLFGAFSGILAINCANITRYPRMIMETETLGRTAFSCPDLKNKPSGFDMSLSLTYPSGIESFFCLDPAGDIAETFVMDRHRTRRSSCAVGSSCAGPLRHVWMVKNSVCICDMCKAGEYWERETQSCSTCGQYSTNNHRNTRDTCKDRRRKKIIDKHSERKTHHSIHHGEDDANNGKYASTATRPHQRNPPKGYEVLHQPQSKKDIRPPGSADDQNDKGENFYHSDEFTNFQVPDFPSHIKLILTLHWNSPPTRLAFSIGGETATVLVETRRIRDTNNKRISNEFEIWLRLPDLTEDVHRFLESTELFSRHVTLGNIRVELSITVCDQAVAKNYETPELATLPVPGHFTSKKLPGDASDGVSIMVHQPTTVLGMPLLFALVLLRV